MLHLKDVTLCSLDYSNLPLTIMAMKKCLDKVNFGDVMLFSGKDVETNLPLVRVDFSGLPGQYNKWCINNWPLYIKTKYALMVHWDGFILDESQWSDEFLEYDYIGDPWYWHNENQCVGNGGFNLRSIRLMDACINLSKNYNGKDPEDFMIGCAWRPELEQKYGCKFPSRQIAQKFSYERTQPNEPTFGFHGHFNMWRHFSDDEMIDMAATCNEYVIGRQDWYELLIHYFFVRKFNVFFVYYDKLKEKFDADTIFANINKISPNGVASAILNLCENRSNQLPKNKC